MAEDELADVSEVEWLRIRLERERQTRLEAETMAERALRRYYEADRLKGLFVATVSHELRTPLTSVSGFLETLMMRWDELDDDARRQMVELAGQHAEVLVHLIESLLDFTRLERGDLELALEEVELSAAASSIVDELAPLLKDHRVVLDAPDEVAAHADPAAVRRILVNLLDNAAKYAPPGSKITVAVFAEGKQAVLAVGDQGPGIPEHLRRTLFEKFTRGESEREYRSRGMGIGLAVVKGLVERMGGSVTLDDEHTDGARFEVRLPLVGQGGLSVVEPQSSAS